MRKYMSNAEHNCRKDKKPYIGDRDNGSLKSYNVLFKMASAKVPGFTGAKWNQKIDVINKLYQTYIKDYFWPAPVSIIISKYTTSAK